MLFWLFLGAPNGTHNASLRQVPYAGFCLIVFSLTRCDAGRLRRPCRLLSSSSSSTQGFSRCAASTLGFAAPRFQRFLSA
jgi:hypothetical protein